MAKGHRARGVTDGSCHSGVWQSGLVVRVLRYTPPSDDIRTGHASVATCVSKTMAPMSSWPPAVRVYGPDHAGVLLVPQRGAPPGAGLAGVVQVTRYRLTSPNQRSNTLLPLTSDRWLVATNGIRPCARGLKRVTCQVAPPGAFALVVS